MFSETLIPSALAQHLQENILSYLNTTFNIRNEAFALKLVDFLSGSDGIFKGPHLDVKLPFRFTKSGESNLLEIDPRIKPFEHQSEAFRRLSSKEHQPENTLVVTGTGSGKSECFFLPILDHCLRARKEQKKGVKAVILYPMNALAFDQARRLAELIWNHPELTTPGDAAPFVTAGILVGEDRDDVEKRKTHKIMTRPNRLIDDRAALIKNPPDILLTNYKMLDLLLMKPNFKGLWDGAAGADGALQFIVLDEMHTYDGAQGTDVALLIRRLKSKLGIKDGKLACVGTSATLFSGIEGTKILCTFANRLFGEVFDERSIIRESRQSLDEVFEGVAINQAAVIPKDDAALEYKEDGSLTDYIDSQIKLWFSVMPATSVELGAQMLSHPLLPGLLKSLGGKSRLEAIALEGLKVRGQQITARQIHSFLSILAHSKRIVEFNGSTIEVPLFSVRVQLWVRELRRILSSLHANEPRFHWYDDQKTVRKGRFLPPIFCEECGEQGYLAAVNKQGDFEWDVAQLYEKYAQSTSTVRYLFAWREIETSQVESEEILRQKLKICPECGLYEYFDQGQKQHSQCPTCQTAWTLFRIWDCLSEERNRDKRQCPSCDTRYSLRLVASRATTLSSVVNGQLFLSRHNPISSKKLLVFADSVQDASHRAGYYNARTYRFNFRTAVQSFLLKKGKELPLVGISDEFLKHWETSIGREKCVATFCPSDLASNDAYEEFFEEGKHSGIDQLLRPRIDWEVYLEYGLRSQVGRTLEKTLSSCAYVHHPDLLGRIAKVREELAREYSWVSEASPQRFNHFVLGLLKRTLIRGGIGLQAFVPYRTKENAWLLDKRYLPWVSRMPKGRLDGSETGALPKFLTLYPEAKTFDFVGAPGQHANWFTFWLKKNLSHEKVPFQRSDFDRIYGDLLDALVDAEILDHLDFDKHERGTFGIRPDRVHITGNVSQLQCGHCAYKLAVPTSQVDSWNGLGCISIHCKGVYVVVPARSSASYYRGIYESGDIERIFAREHTGLLSRRVREELETEFKAMKDRRADAANLLSCTPTLEMGIDVGDLSATVVGALPKAASNYQQQVGRAGRKSGSALIVAIAQARPRDLLFFQYPEELIDGHIEPPGCFLDAPDILKRQFLAYLFDHFYADLTKGVELKLSSLRAEVRGGSGAEGFLKNLTELLKAHGPTALVNWKNQFAADVVSSHSWDELSAEFIPDKNSQVRHVRKIRNLCEAFDAQMNEIARASESVQKSLKPLEDKEAAGAKLTKEETEEYRELRRERATLEAQKEASGGKDGFFEFLAHHGLLPNYAFQEDAVELVGIILDDGKGDGKKTTVRFRESFDRPAKMALRELAPESTFYGGGRKLEIDQLDVGGRSRSLIEKWRACRACGFLARQIAEEAVAGGCPRCGDHQWRDTGAAVTMLRLHRAIAVETTNSSQIGDEAEDRQKKFFKIRPFFDIAKGAVRQAWAYTSDDFVFGIEFLSRLTLREVNFGQDSTLVSDRMEVAGEQLPKGFKVCFDCGRVAHLEGEKGEMIHHTAACRHSKTVTRPEGRKQVPTDSPLLLYRELHSEAIRVLLPVSEYEAEGKTASIKAALFLGFRKKFGGQPLHLEIGQQRVIEPGGDSLSRRYLVLFDAVPGGTGFLHELWTKDSFFDLIKKSLEAMNTCSCISNPDLDGCPRCVFGGAAQFELPLISRVEAVKYLTEILAREGQMQTLPEGLEAVEMSGFLDSELEYEFLSILKGLSDPDFKVKLSRFKMEVSDHKFSEKADDPLEFTITSTETGKSFRYRVSAHKMLNKGERTTEADFYFERLDAPNIPSLALYLDGFRHHAGPQTGSRLAGDFLKREALVNGDGVSKHFVWNLTWHDVKKFQSDPAERPARYFGFSHNDPQDFMGQNAVVQLFRFLAGERPTAFGRAAAGLAKSNGSADVLEQLKTLEQKAGLIRAWQSVIAATTSGPASLATHADDRMGTAVIKVGQSVVFALAFESPAIGRETPEFFDAWERLLHSFNILQSLGAEMTVKVWAEE